MFKNKWTKVLSILLIIMMSFLVGCDEEVENIDNTKIDTNTYSEETKGLHTLFLQKRTKVRSSLVRSMAKSSRHQWLRVLDS